MNALIHSILNALIRFIRDIQDTPADQLESKYVVPKLSEAKKTNPWKPIQGGKRLMPRNKALKVVQDTFDRIKDSEK